MKTNRKDILILFAWIAVFEAVSAIIGMATASGVSEWYKTLNRPSFTPPNWIFPVMWSLLYALIAAAGWRISRIADKNVRKPLLGLFAIYMGLNWTWSFVFFSAHEIFAGFVWILAINLAAIAIIIRARGTDKIVSLLMILPLCWTLFAAVLNGAYWQLNP